MPTDPRYPDLDALTREAIALLRRGHAEAAAPLVAAMGKLLTDRPEVFRQMRRIVEVVAFDWPAARSSIRLGAVAPPDPADIELVAFHVGLEGSDAPAVDYGRLLSQLFESAQLRAPAARRVLLTDERTVLPSFASGVAVVRCSIDPARLMYERMRVQREYLRARRAGAATVFLDSDVVVNAEPSAIFAEDFDVGLTHRPVVDAPFNGGVIFVAAGSAGERFFGKALACYDALAEAPAIAALYPRDLRAWWGDQFALAALVGWRALAERQGDGLGVDGVRVRIFPCETHNYTIEPRMYGAVELAGKHFIHFKGSRKEMMAAYLMNLRGQTTSCKE